MSVLLTTSAAPERSPFSTNEKRPPLGLGILLSVLREAGHRVLFRDPYLDFDPDFPGPDLLRGEDVELVGIYSNTICFQDTLRMCRRLQRLRQDGLWDGRIAVGGPHASVAPDTLPSYVDHVVVGEGEELICDLAEGTAPRGVLRGPLVEDLDSVPRPPYDLFTNMPYQFDHRAMDCEPVYMLNTSRGCPYRCAFCSVRSIWGRTYRAMSAGRVLDDVEWLVTDYDARGVYFREDHFTLSPERTRAFCEGLLRRGLRIEWACESRADSLDPDLLRLMERAGCRWLYIGVESGSPRMLQIMHKEETLGDFRNAFGWCRQAGIKTYASFVVGMPGETPRDVRSTLRFAREIEPDSVTFNIFVGIPDSPWYQQARAEHLVRQRDANGLLFLKGHDLRALGVYGGYATRVVMSGSRLRWAARALGWLYDYCNRWPELRERLQNALRRMMLVHASRYLSGAEASTEYTGAVSCPEAHHGGGSR